VKLQIANENLKPSEVSTFNHLHLLESMLSTSSRYLSLEPGNRRVRSVGSLLFTKRLSVVNDLLAIVLQHRNQEDATLPPQWSVFDKQSFCENDRDKRTGIYAGPEVAFKACSTPGHALGIALWSVPSCQRWFLDWLDKINLLAAYSPFPGGFHEGDVREAGHRIFQDLSVEHPHVSRQEEGYKFSLAQTIIHLLKYGEGHWGVRIELGDLFELPFGSNEQVESITWNDLDLI